MIKLIIYLYFLFSFLLLIRLKWKFIFFLPIFNLLADMSFSYFAGFSAPTLMRAAINFIFLVYVAREIKTVKMRSYFYVFFAVILALLMFSESFVYSFRVSVQIIMSMSMLLAGYAVFRKAEGFEYLISNLRLVIIMAVIATAVGYLFGVGRSLEYTTSRAYDSVAENVGLLGSGGMYAPGLVLSLFPFLLRLQRSKIDRIILIGSSALLYLFILLNVRRTAIAIPIVGLLGFIMYIPDKAKVKIMKYVLIIAIGLILSYPIYSTVLNKRYEFRASQGRFEKGFYKTEARYLETMNMFDEIIQLEEPLKVMFGIGNNLFADQYENGILERRMIHSDIPKIFYSMGILGVILYIIIYLSILRAILAIPSTGELRNLKAACLGLLLISVFVSLNGSITLFSFRALNFLLLGAFLGYSRKLMYTNGELPADKEAVL